MEDPACLFPLGYPWRMWNSPIWPKSFKKRCVPLNRCMNHLDLFLLVMFYGLGSHGIRHHSTAIWENMLGTFQELCQILLV